MDKEKVLKFAGIGATIAGVGASLLSGWVGEKKLDDTITKKVSEAIAKTTEKA